MNLNEGGVLGVVPGSWGTLADAGCVLAAATRTSKPLTPSS